MTVRRSQLILSILSGLPLLIGSVFALLVLDSSTIGNIISSSQGYNLGEIIIQSIVSIALGMLVVFSLFQLIQRRGRRARKLVIAFLISPILYFVSVFIGEAFLLLLFKGSRNVFQGFILILSLGISMLSLVMIVMDAIPTPVKNIFVSFYGSIFGIFLGITMVTPTMFVVVISLIVEDYLLTRHSPVADDAIMSGRIGADPFDYTRIQSESVSIGVGDYIAYALISAHAFVFLPFHVWAMSMLLASAGVIVNVFVFAEEDSLLPAIPLPATLALIPWIVHILVLSAIIV